MQFDDYIFTLETNPFAEQVIPSRFFSDVYDFFSYDQFRPMWLRNDDLGHDLDIRIVDKDRNIRPKPGEEGEVRKLDEGKECFMPERLKSSGAKELAYSSIIAASLAIYTLY